MPKSKLKKDVIAIKANIKHKDSIQHLINNLEFKFFKDKS